MKKLQGNDPGYITGIRARKPCKHGRKGLIGIVVLKVFVELIIFKENKKNSFMEVKENKF